MATRSQVATDSFTGTDATNLSGTWTQLNDSSSLMRIYSNATRSSHVSQAAARSTATFANDQYSVVTLAGTITTDEARIGVIVRASADTNANRDFYGYELHGDASITSRLFKMVDGSRTELGSDTATSWSVGDTIEIEVEGTALRGMRNGVTVISTTDASLSTGKAGVCGQGGFASMLGDNWIGGDLIASSGVPKTTKLALLGVG